MRNILAVERDNIVRMAKKDVFQLKAKLNVKALYGMKIHNIKPFGKLMRVI